MKAFRQLMVAGSADEAALVLAPTTPLMPHCCSRPCTGAPGMGPAVPCRQPVVHALYQSIGCILMPHRTRHLDRQCIASLRPCHRVGRGPWFMSPCLAAVRASWLPTDG
jgi:hypothetical protein